MKRKLNIPTQIQESIVENELNGLLENRENPEIYRQHMTKLGKLLASTFVSKLEPKSKVLAISTAEDADYLLTGVLNELKIKKINTCIAVFWNHHHSLPTNGQSVAPILHQYLQPGYEDADIIVIVKSVISGSCVVRTNLLAMFEQVKSVKKVFVVSPVMHNKAHQGLSSEFSEDIAEKFEYIYFALDEKKTETGEVLPGIGGQIYKLLGIGNQPALTGYMPKLVLNMINS